MRSVLTSNMSHATSDSEEVAAFSPEGLDNRAMIERCNGRMDHALLAGDNDKAQA